MTNKWMDPIAAKLYDRKPNWFTNDDDKSVAPMIEEEDTTK